MKKFFLVLTSLFVIGTSSFALDAKTLWTSYGGGLKNGSSVINAGIGLTSIFGYGIAIPPLSISYERCVLIADMLPFSFGGNVSFFGFGDSDIFYSNIAVDAFAKYHVNFGVPNLDVYAGLAIGPGFHWYKDYAAVYFNWGTFIGAGWYFTDNFGLVAEAGYPYWLNVKASFKF